MNAELAPDYLKLVVEKEIRHPNYQRVCDLAKDYFAYYTGEGLNERLQQVTSTETDDEFKQRCLLTKHITKSVLNSTKIPFNKALRKKPEFNKIDFITKGKEKSITEINDYLEKFNGTKSLDKYLEILFIEFNYHDPNAWLIVEFEPNDPTRKAQPYPFLATAKEVIDFRYNNGILDYLVVMLPIKYIDNKEERDGFKWTMYNGNETIVIQSVASNYQGTGNQTLFSIKKDKYSLEVFQVKADSDPELTPAGMRFGYIKDPQTQYNTYLSIFDCSMPYLEKTLKVNSELDQSMAMVAFPQRFAYQPRCTAEGCYKGKMTHDGSDCPVCKGTGSIQAHSGAQQIMYLPLPDNKEEMIDLNGMLVSKGTDIELLTFDKEYINQLKIDIHTTIFNVDLISKNEVSATATEQLLNRDNMNDTLLPFARHYSELRSMCVYFVAVYTDNVSRIENGEPDIIITHKFPYDFKLKTMTELMTDLKTAYDSKASTVTIVAIEDDINEILYFDRPDELKKIRTINKYNPFRGNTPDEVKLLIASNLVSKFDQVLYTNLFNIFAELERDNQEPWIYDLPETKIYDLVKVKVEERIQILDSEKPQEVKRLDYTNNNIDEPQNNEEIIVYDDQIQINFKTNNKFSHSDEDLLIAPVVLMSEGVHIGSHGAILHQISELGKFPATWNGIPIVINHPKKEDKYISANNPEVLQKISVGRVFNTKVEDDKLKSEAWFDKNKLLKIYPELLEDLEAGNEIEVSIGAFPEYKIKQGIWGDEKYDAIAVNYRPDHLAILPNSKGACSIEDGAGINVNGGEGSGNFGHEGRPGEVGGSQEQNFEKLIKLYGSESEVIRNIKDDVDEKYYNSIDYLEKEGYVISQGSDSKTDFGHSRYFYVNDQKGSISNNNGLGVKVRVSDHSVSNYNRVIEEIHISSDNDNSIKMAKKEIDYIFKPNLFKKEDYKYSSIIKLTIPTKKLLPTDKIKNTRINKKGIETNEIERTIEKNGVKIIDTRDDSIFRIY